ncbi:MAG: DUF2939 domain-containing protein [Pseudoxanthomonas sp.]
MPRWAKWALGVVLAALLALGGCVAAGPYVAIHGIRQALAERDMDRLARHVDFPALRVNLRAQLQDRIARAAGPGLQSGLLGSLLLSMAGGVAGAGVDTLVTPAGVAAMLEGRAVWKRAGGQTVDGDSWGDTPPADPLKGAREHFESSSRFTATVPADGGQPVVFVFTRQGLRWRLTDIVLPSN